MNTPEQNNKRSVFVAITGRPNVGKSSLLNRLVGEKAAIVTPKPQTTRTRVTGIVTQGPVQYVFFDTPGIHQPRTKLGGHMVQTVHNSVADGDVALMLFEPKGTLTLAETQLIESLRGGVALAAINKADTVPQPAELNARREELLAMGVFGDVLQISAHSGAGCEALLEKLAGYALAGPHYFANDMYTSQPEKVMAAEILREKLLLLMQDEIPHGIAVEIDTYKEREHGRMIDIEASILCERKSHKGMVIGKGGAMLKQAASAARKDIEAFTGAKINLQCWVKVREHWRDNEKALGRMGFGG